MSDDDSDFEEYVLREHPNSMTAARIRVHRAMHEIGEVLLPAFERQAKHLNTFAEKIVRAVRERR